jgi:hypothetical protein
MRTRATVLLTTPRSVTGFIDHGDARLSDAVNSPLLSVLRVQNAILGRIGNADANGPFDLAIVPKEQIALIYATMEVARPIERRLSLFVAKQTTEILMLLAGLRLQGHAHAPTQLDAERLHHLVFDGRGFMVLTDATLALDVEGTTARAIGVAIVNVAHVQFVALAASAASNAAEPAEVAVSSR